VKVRFTVRGRAQAKKEIEWWRANRQDCPERVFEELQEAISRIRSMPRVHKPYGRLDGELVWRMMTLSTRLHVYYTIDEAHEVAHIEYVWGARRGQLPPLDD
jgi:hypothetical protein